VSTRQDPSQARWLQIEALYHAALERDVATRAAFLDEACAGDAPLRREVDALLAQGPHSVTALGREAEAAALDGPPGPDLVGRQVGVYQVVSRLGAGGMGEVYRARDTRLGREVALKVLPVALADDLDRRARLEREARLLAALNHPHIAAIYGLEESEGRLALVLELVEGLTLADRLAAGALPVAEALALARQVAKALEAAHRKGIVHRDLKPANVKLTPDGVVKVLDFGLAKALGAQPAGLELSQAPTVPADLTREGVIAGTVAYMSPEQARGRPVDKRTDIWAFGCVLFELLAGRIVFAGETLSDTLARVLEREPDWQALPAATPARVRDLLRRCLHKDVEQRLADLAEARGALTESPAWRIGGWDATGLSARLTSLLGLGRRYWLIGAATGVVAAGVYTLGWQPLLRPTGVPAPRATFSQLTSRPGGELFPSLSPDGRWVVYSGEGAGNRDVFLQSTSGQTPINLTADSPDDDEQPAFSPDGEQIAFRSSRGGGGLFVMGRTGEAVRRVTREGFNPAWSPDGTHLAYTTVATEFRPQNAEQRGRLMVVAVAGGEPRPLYDNAMLPSWSPSGARIAFSGGVIGTGGTANIATIPAAGGSAVPVTQDAFLNWNPVWSPDGAHLYFASNRGGSMNLWRVAIHEASGRPRREPEPISSPASFATHLSISADGRRLAYTAVIETQNIQKLHLDPDTGKVLGRRCR
jgi:eukaryotic-like serine/threonine-protein kinase